MLSVVAFVHDIDADRASGVQYAPAVSSRLDFIPTWLPQLLGSEPRIPRPNCSQVGAMPPAINMDIKVSFELFDMTPGSKGRRFMQNLLLHGGGFVDDRGFSYADTFLRMDEGAVVGPAFAVGAGAAPGAVAMPAAAGELRAATMARRKRIKGAFGFITRHISDEHTLQMVGDPASPLFQDGPELHDMIRAAVVIPVTTSELQDMNIDWYEIEIMTDVGSSTNTVKDALKLLRFKNAERPQARQFTNDEVAEKLLMMIKNGSKTFSESAANELNALEGVPGQPGVRLFQGAVPVAIGGVVPPRPRDLLAITNHFHTLWDDAVKHGRIPKAAATGRKPRDHRAMMAEENMPRDAARMMREVAEREVARSLGEHESSFTSLQTGGRSVSPTATLGVIQEAGFSVSRGTTTTSNFSLIGAEQIALAVSADGEGEGFDLEMCFDADDTPSIEPLCNNCRAPGHLARSCPSPKKFRSFSYVISLLQNAEARAEKRGSERGHAPGGRRPLPRGQKQPFRPMPRRFNAPAAGPRGPRFAPATPRPPTARLTLEDAHAQPPTAEADDGVRTATETEPAGTVGAVTTVDVKGDQARKALVGRETQDKAPPMPTAFGLSDAGYFETAAGRSATETAVVSGLTAVDTAASSPVPATQIEPPAGRRTWLVRAVGLLVMFIGAAAAIIGDLSSTGLLTAVRTTRDALTMAGGCLLDARMHGAVVCVVGCWIMQRAGAMGAEVPVVAAARVGMPAACPWDATAVLSPAETMGLLGIEKAWLAGPEHKLPPTDTALSYMFCFDSGATSLCLPEQDAWMMDVVTDPHPQIGLEVASGTTLPVVEIGQINGGSGDPVMVVDTFEVGEDGNEVATVTAPHHSRVLITRGLKTGTRLVGVTAANKLDGINSYFNDDNSAGLDAGVRFKNGSYARFANSRNELVYRRFDAGSDRTRLRQESEQASVGWQSTDGRGGTVARRSLAPGMMTAADVHAAFCHVGDARIKASDLTIFGQSLNSFEFDAGACAGCRAGMTHTHGSRKTSAPSMGGRAPRPALGQAAPRQPSTTGYSYFGQRIDTDMSTSFPPSFPHGFTIMTNFCDRHTAEFFLAFQIQPSAHECGSSLDDFRRRVEHRLEGGQVTRFHTDNDMAFDGPEFKLVAEELVRNHTRTVAHEKNRNPVAERNFGVIEGPIRACIAHANAPECLWVWAAMQLESILYLISTKAHLPPVSPFRFSNPDAPSMDMSWTRPLFCDVTVHLPVRDVGSKVAETGADGCYLGHDFRRNCEYVYLPKQRRLASFVVTSWRCREFTICQRITSDTPVEYDQMSDLRFGRATAAMLPKRLAKPRASKAAEKEGAMAAEKEGATVEGAAAWREIEIENADRIQQGVEDLSNRSEQEVLQAAIEAASEERATLRVASGLSASERAVLMADDRVVYGHAGTWRGEDEIEINLIGSESARKVAAQFGIPKIRTIAEAMASPYWPMIKDGLESEIAGKLANKSFAVVKAAGKRVLKSKWVIDFKLADDGSILSVKCRFVGCGYSQVAGVDYDQTYAATLPGCCFRYWCSVVADEDLDTDSIDAVKAFTQSDVDREIYVAMPVGFAIDGYCLLLLKALEGIKQGSFLWFQKNKWAWNKCGLIAGPHEPNLYTHATLTIIAAVFADDVGAAFKPEQRAEYLLIRAEYGKLIKIDSPGPDIVVPVTKFTGINIGRDRDAGTLWITMESYIAKLEDRHKGEYTLNEMPTGKTKAAREAFEKMEAGTPETMGDRSEFLELLGECAWPAAMGFPECAYGVSFMGRFMMYPQKKHTDAAMHMIGYIVNRKYSRITYGGRLKVPLGL